MARIIITNVHTREEREIDQAALPFFPDWIYTRDAVASVPSDLPVYLSTDQFVAAVSDASNEVGAALRAAFVPANPVIANVVMDSDGNWTSWTEDGIAHSATYDSTTGNVATLTVAGVTRTFTFDANDNLVGAA